MNSDEDNKRQITRYLLGELSDEEQIHVEERFFADSNYFREVEAMRDELIDDYLQGELSSHEQERFVQYFLASPSRREKVESARALMQALSKVTITEESAVSGSRKKIASRWLVFPSFFSTQTSTSRFVIGGALCLILIAGSWLVFETMRMRKQLEQMRTERDTIYQRQQELQRQLDEQQKGSAELTEQLRHEQSERERLVEEMTPLKSNRNGAKPEPDQLLIASLMLGPVQVRDADKVPELKLGQGIERVRLQARFEGEQYNSYRATLQTIEGKTLMQRGGLKASGNIIVLSLSADAFQEGDYLLTLSGVKAQGATEDIGKYFFRVVKQ